MGLGGPLHHWRKGDVGRVEHGQAGRVILWRIWFHVVRLECQGGPDELYSVAHDKRGVTNVFERRGIVVVASRVGWVNIGQRNNAIEWIAN